MTYTTCWCMLGMLLLWSSFLLFLLFLLFRCCCVGPGIGKHRKVVVFVTVVVLVKEGTNNRLVE